MVIIIGKSNSIFIAKVSLEIVKLFVSGEYRPRTKGTY